MIVTGTGRCGTVYMSRFLSDIGIQCGHESFFCHDGWAFAKRRLLGKSPLELSKVSQKDMVANEVIGSSWLDCSSIVADSSYMAAPFLNHSLLSGVSVIHIIRNPFKVITSFVKDFGYFVDNDRRDSYQKFIYAHLPRLIDYKDPIDAATYFYLEWNKMIELNAKVSGRRYLRQKIEDIPSPDFLKFISRPRPEVFFDDVDINSHKRDQRSDITLNDIPNNKLRRALALFALVYQYI